MLILLCSAVCALLPPSALAAKLVTDEVGRIMFVDQNRTILLQDLLAALDVQQNMSEQHEARLSNLEQLDFATSNYTASFENNMSSSVINLTMATFALQNDLAVLAQGAENLSAVVLDLSTTVRVAQGDASIAQAQLSSRVVVVQQEASRTASAQTTSINSQSSIVQQINSNMTTQRSETSAVRSIAEKTQNLTLSLQTALQSLTSSTTQSVAGVTSNLAVVQSSLSTSVASVQARSLLDRVPVGTILDWYPPQSVLNSNSNLALIVPSGYALCDGSRVTDSSSPFYNANVPNFNSRFALGTTNRASFGATGGSDTHVHSIGSDGSHFHTQNGGDISGDAGRPWHAAERGFATSTAGLHSHGGSTGSTSTYPPYVQVLKIIRIK